MTTLIALSGHIEAGKDEFVKLASKNFPEKTILHLKLADPFRSLISTMTGLSEECISDIISNRQDKENFPLLDFSNFPPVEGYKTRHSYRDIALNMDVLRLAIHPYLWSQVLINRLSRLDLSKVDYILISDVRKPLEVTSLANFCSFNIPNRINFQSVYIHSDKALAKFKDKYKLHEFNGSLNDIPEIPDSEAHHDWIWDYSDFKIYNTGSLEDYSYMVKNTILYFDGLFGNVSMQ